MGYETVGGGISDGNYAPAKYVRYTHPEERDLTEKDLLLKKDQSVEGYFLKSYERQTNHGNKWNHVLVQTDGTHIVIPDNKDVTAIFLGERIVKGAKTRFTYLGKVSFEYDKDGKKGTAKAVKALVEQDRTDTVEFEGTNGCEAIKGTASSLPKTGKTEASITANEVPF